MTAIGRLSYYYHGQQLLCNGRTLDPIIIIQSSIQTFLPCKNKVKFSMCAVGAKINKKRGTGDVYLEKEKVLFNTLRMG